MAENAIALPRIASAGADLVAGWRALPARGRIAGMVAAAAGVAVLTAAWLWTQAPDFAVLVSGVENKEGGAIVTALTQKNIPFQIKDNGVIMVPSALVHSTRMTLASMELLKGKPAGYEIVDKQKFGATQFQEQLNHQRAIEGELTRTIESLSAVRSARVQLALPKQSIFMREQQKPSASVVLSLYADDSLDKAQISGIMHLVSAAVPGLSPRNVAVVDGRAKLLSPTAEDGAAGKLDASQLSYVREIEQGHIKRILDILAPLYGENNVRAQVSADVDFSHSESTSENFAPNQTKDASAVRSQQVSESGSGGAGAGGVPGALSNQPPGPASAPIAGAPTVQGGAAAAAAAAGSRREAVTNYEVDKTVRHVRNSTGTVKRLTAAIVVNHKKAPAAKPGAAPAPVPLGAEELAKVEALVKEAMGYSKDRGDSVNIVNAPFTPAEIEALPEAPLWKQPAAMATAREAGKYLLLAGILIYLVFGVLRPLVRHALAHRPAPVAEPAAQTEAAAAAALPNKTLDQARILARQDPKVVANVVRNWVNSGG